MCHTSIRNNVNIFERSEKNTIKKGIDGFSCLTDYKRRLTVTFLIKTQHQAALTIEASALF